MPFEFDIEAIKAASGPTKRPAPTDGFSFDIDAIQAATQPDPPAPVEQPSLLGAQQLTMNTPETPMDANTRAAIGRVHPEILSKNYFDGVKKLSEAGRRFKPLSGDVQRKLEALAQLQTMQFATDIGLALEDGSIPRHLQGTVNKFKEALLTNSIVFNSQVTPEEMPSVAQKGFGRGLDHAVKLLRTELHAAQAESDRPDKQSYRGNQIANAIVQLNSLKARLGEPKIQRMLAGHMKEMISNNLDRTGDSTEEELQSAVTNDILSISFDKVWPSTINTSYQDSPWGSAVLRSLRFAFKDRRDAYSHEKLMETMFRGAVTEHRMEALGVPPEAAAKMTPIELVRYTHPKIFEKIDEAAAGVEARDTLISAGIQPSEELTTSFRDSILERAGGPSVMDRVLKAMPTEEEILASGIDLSEAGNVGVQIRELSERINSIVGDKAMWGLDKIAEGYDHIVKGAEILTGGALTDVRGMAVRTALKQRWFAKAAPLVTAGHISEVEKSMEEAEQEISQYRSTDDHGLYSDNPYFGNFDKYIKTSRDGTTFLTEETKERIFNPDGSPIRMVCNGLFGHLEGKMLEKFNGLDLNPYAIRVLYKKTKEKLASEGLERSFLTGYNDSQVAKVEAINSVVWRDFKEGKATMGDVLASNFSLLAAKFGQGWRKTFQQAMLRPDTIVFTEVAGAGIGEILHGASAAIRKNPAIQKITKAARMERAKYVVGEALASDPRAVKNLQSFLQDTLPNTPEGQRAAIKTATDQLDDLVQRNRMQYDDGGHMIDIGDAEAEALRRDLQDAGKVADMVDPGSVDALLSSLKIDDNVAEWIKRPELMRDFNMRAGRIANKERRYLNKYLTRSLRAGEQGAIEQIVRNPAITNEELIASPLQFRSASKTKWWQRVNPRRARDYQAAHTKSVVLDWYNNMRTMALGIRRQHAETRVRNMGWADRVITRECNNLRELAAARAMAPSEKVLKELGHRAEVIRGVIKSAESFKNQMRQMQFDQALSIDFKNHPLFKSAPLHEVLSHIAETQGPGQLYKQMRNKFETEAMFRKRMQRLNSYMDVTDLSLRARLKREAEVFKNRTLREFFNNDGLQRADFDSAGHYVSPKTRSRSEKEYIALANNKQHLDEMLKTLDPNDAERIVKARELDLKRRAFLREHDINFFEAEARGDIESLLGFVSEGERLSTGWKAMKRLARVEKAAGIRASRTGLIGIRAALVGNFIENLSNLQDGNGIVARQAAKVQGLLTRINIAAGKRRLKAIERRRNKLSLNDQATLDAAWTIQRDEGVAGPILELRKDPRFKEYFEGLMPPDQETALRRVYDESETFRRDIILSGLDAGMFSREQAADLLGPYAPRLFYANEEKRLFGLKPKGGKKTKAISSADGDEFLEQRHHSKYKVRVVQRGARAIEETFDNRLQAEAYVREHFGVKGKFSTIKSTYGPAGVEAATAIKGQRARILDPLDDKLIEVLGGELEAGKGMMVRLEDLLMDVEKIKYANTFDRPNLALTAKEYEAVLKRDAAKTNEAPEADIYTDAPLPNNRRVYGNLAGKHVHRKIAAEIDHFTHGRFFAKALAETVKDDVATADLVKKIMAVPVAVGKVFREAITTCQVAMNSACISMNLISDNLFGGRAAAGASFNWSLKGWRDRASSFKMLADIQRGKRALDDMPEMFKHAYNRGMFDEQTLANIDGADAEYVKTVWGHGDENRGFIDYYRHHLGIAIAPLKDPKVRALMHRLERLQTKLADPALSPRDAGIISSRIATLKEKMALDTGKLGKLWARAVNAKNVLLAQRSGVFGERRVEPELYSLTQNTTRLAAYKHLVDKGMPWDEAIDRVQAFMQNYSQVPDGVRKLAGVPGFSPIISFPYETIRNTLNVARHEPGFFAGFLTAVPALNALSLGAGGVDPGLIMAELRRNGNSLADVYSYVATTFMAPDSQGGIIPYEAPQINIPLTMLGSGHGLLPGQAEMFAMHGEDGLHYGAVSQAMRAAGNWVLGGPVLNSMVSLVRQKDNFGRPYQSIGDSVVAEAGKLARLFVPPQAPVIGNAAARNMETIEAPRYLYTGREKELLSRIVRSWIGVNARKGFPVPEGLRSAAAKVTYYVAAAMDPVAAAQGRIPTTEDKLIGRSNFGSKDILQYLIIESAPLDATGTILQPRNASPEEIDIRRAAAMKNSGAAGTIKRGEELEERAVANYERRLGNITKHSNTTDEAIAVLKREAEKLDVLGVLNEMKTPRRMYIIARAIELGAKNALVDSLNKAVYLTEQGNWRKPRSVGDVKDSIGYLQKAARVTRNPKHQKILSQWIAYMKTAGMFYAQMAERKKAAKEPLLQEAAQRLREYHARNSK